jgi:electron transfer flavoprotein alpha subunit
MRWRRLIGDGGHEYALFGGGLLGFEIGAGLSARLDAGVCMEVTNVRVEDAKLVAERPILQDSQVSDVHYASGVGVIIGRLNAFEVRESATRTPPWRTSRWSSPRTRCRRRWSSAASSAAPTSTSRTPTSSWPGGRGLGKAEGFETLEELPGRSAARRRRRARSSDAGWYSYSAQIGQTGKTVAPKLYLAAGISGAIQHKVGMQGSENIVAINKDANAPIFEFSDLGIVGDLNKIVPKLTEAVKARRAAERGGRTHRVPAAGRRGGGVRRRADGPRGRADRGRRGDRRRRQAGLACAIRLLQLLEDDPELTESLGEVPVAVIEKGRVAGAHQLSGAVMNPARSTSCCPTTARGRTTARSAPRRSTSCSTASGRSRSSRRRLPSGTTATSSCPWRSSTAGSASVPRPPARTCCRRRPGTSCWSRTAPWSACARATRAATRRAARSRTSSPAPT